MRSVRINNDSYNIPTDWSDIPLCKLGGLQQLSEGLPQGVVDYYMGKEEVLPDESAPAKLSFERSAISLLCDIPDSIVAQTEDSDIVALCEGVLYPFVVSAFGYFTYQLTWESGFEYKGVAYNIPSFELDVAGEKIPLHELKALPFCEASDIAASDDLSLASLVVSLIVCEGEYDSKMIKTRANDFKELPANIFWEAYGQLQAAHKYMANEYPGCYPKSKGKGKPRKDISTWCDRLLYVAGDKPSELPYVEKIGYTDFLRLLEGKLKRENEQWSMMMPK